MASIRAGDPAPDFTLTDQHGEALTLSDYRGTWVVAYFYPADDTPGCTVEACSFRDAYEDFTDAGAEVIGISSQDEESKRKFAEKHNLPFKLVADPDSKIRKSFGVPKTLGLLPGRVTYVIDPEGVVRKVFNSQFGVKKHTGEALATINAG